MKNSKKNEFREPDLFVLKDQKLFLLLEVAVVDTYKANLKVKIMKQSAKHIVIFEPVKNINKTKLKPKNVTGQKEVEEYYQKKWEQEEGIKVEFWNEDGVDAFDAHIKKLKAETERKETN